MEDKFIVPQFIDAEDKIWGPITVRQFVIVLVGGLLVFIAYKLADFSLFIFETIIIIALVAIFAFYKYNGAPFHVFAFNFIQTIKKPKSRIWGKQEVPVITYHTKNEGATAPPPPRKPLVSNKKISELSLVIDTGGIYKGEKYSNQENNIYK